MSIRVSRWLFLLWSVLGTKSAVFAQNHLHLDAQLGGENAFAERAYFGKYNQVLKPRLANITSPLPVLLFRWQSQQWSVSTGYSGGYYSYGYKLKLPHDMIRNPYGQRVFGGVSSSPHGFRIPLLVGRRLADVNLWPLSDEVYLLSFRVEALLGGGLQAKSHTCLDCGQLSLGGNGYDDVRFNRYPYWRRRWGPYLTAGATARFYRKGKERATLRLLVTQGLQDMITVPLDYYYNGRSGSTTLHVRGSGINLTLGYPFLLHTFGKPGPE